MFLSIKSNKTKVYNLNFLFAKKISPQRPLGDEETGRLALTEVAVMGIENICKGWLRQREHRRCYNISAGQHQPSSGLLNG